MKYKIFDYPAIYTHMPQDAIIKSVAKQHLSVFSEDYFKDRWLDDKRSIQNLYRDTKFMSSMKLPSVTISYDISDDPKNTLETTDFPYNYGSHFIAGPLGTYYWKIFKNPVTKAEIFIAFIRKKITLNYRYLYADVYERDNAYNWMNHIFRYGGPPRSYGKSYTAFAPVPSAMLEQLAIIEGYDINVPEDVAKFEEELFKYSGGLLRKHKVTLKETANMWFCVYNLQNMKIIQNDKPEKGDGDSMGMVRTKFDINETMEIEPYIPQMFITKCPEIVNGQKINDKYKFTPVMPVAGIDPRVFKTRDYTVDPVWKDIFNKGYVILSNLEFTVEKNGDEFIPIDMEIYGPDHLKLINEFVKQGRDVNKYYKILMYNYGKRMEDGVEYIADWKNMQIKLFNANTSKTYKLVGVCYREVLEPFLENILVHKLNQEDN